MPRFLLAVIAAAALLQPTQAADGLEAKIGEIINGPDYKHARWGILIVDARTGEPVYAHNADMLCIPASTTKLFSSAAALGTLGADFKFETPVYRRGKLTDGRLQGDLILVASGDLTMGGRTASDGKMAFRDHDHIYANGNIDGELTDTDPLAGLKSLAKQVAAAGIKRVDGDVLIDDRLFVKNRGSGSGPDLVTPILINDNLVDVVITPAAEAGKPALVATRPETRFVQLDADVTTGPEGRQPRVTIEAAGPRAIKIRGVTGVKAKPVVRVYPVEDPSAFARALFMECLRKEGVAVAASALQSSQAELPEKDGYDRLTKIATFTSPPFSEALKVTLKVSHNLYANTLPLLVAVKKGKQTLADGLHEQRRFLSELGVDVHALSFGGGAGGANADSVAPRAAVQLLQAMSKRPDWKVFHDALPILGVDGTLSEAVPATSPARGKVQAKTGTLFWSDVMNDRFLLRSKALAGTMTTAKGRDLYVVVFANDVPLPRGTQPTREGKVIGKVCEVIYENTP
jgi:D-alanyl-D-alanine carboxypeptidase/D-alanyl-D-alanine-endopeptidase (penicillin-binding protein 4)